MIITVPRMQEAARLVMPVARLQEEAKAKFNRIQVCVCVVNLFIIESSS